MKKLRRVLSVVMAFVLLVTGIQVSGLTADAETTWTETPITSLKYEVTVADSVSGGDAVESFEWKVQDATWSEQSKIVALNGDGDYSIEFAFDSVAGMKNLGFITPSNSAMTVTVNKVIVNDYELTYETAPVLKDVADLNALANIWNVSVGAKICGSDTAYLALDQADGAIQLYVAQNTTGGSTGDNDDAGNGDNEGDGDNDASVDADAQWVETAITSVKYDVSVANTSSETEFVWEALDDNSSWTTSKATVAINGDGDYSFELSASAAGMRNLGYIVTVADSSMTVTVNKIIVNGYELTYETAPVLYAGTGDANGLVNIWSGLESGVAICGNDNAYLAFNSDAELIKFYVKQEKSEEPQWAEAAITSVKYDVSVANTSSETEFVWEALDDNSSWATSKATVAINGDGDYSFELSASAAGMRNLGYIVTIADSSMTVTVNKIIVNGYELTYETAPVLYAGTGDANGLVNIWSGLESGVAICSGDNAYLAFDGDASLIKLYTKQGQVSGGGDAVIDSSASLDYMKAMGDGWNLGNSFDGVNTALDEEDLGEVAWGNPVVAKELIQAVADKGYDSIRIPITFYRRFDEETYVIDEAWLARVKEVVQWSLDEGLHVMINVHHDSWLWLKFWDGNKESEEYVKFTKLWEQFATYFKDMPLDVCFETINEPTFEATGDISAQKKLDMVNQAAYDAIRNSGGNNEARMVVIPTFTTNHGEEHVNATISFIEALDDENVMATVHYYSEWVHSAGIGKTGFDEVLWDDYTPRDSVDLFFETLQKKFLDKGIGVVVGEWGLLGYDSASQVNQAGEELKYYEYMNYYANAKDVCLMFWDNGSGISRTSGNYEWKKPLVGEMLETSMSERSAYVTDLDRVFFKAEATEDVIFKLTVNGLTFSGIDGLTEGTDYTYDADAATVTLSKAYVNAKYAEMGEKYGTFAELVFKFSGGANWHEYLIKYDAAVAAETSGTTADIKIPVEFKGSEVRRATAYMASGKVGPNSSWWDYLQYGGAFLPDYETGTIAVLNGFWDDPTVVDGEITFHFEMYDGSMMKYTLKKDGTNIIGYPAIDASQVTMECANEICVYVGETKIKDTYFNIPEGTSVYGTYTKPENATDYITLNGWPATMTFGTKAQENSIEIGLMLTYMDRIEYPGNITFWLKDAPVVEGVTVKEGESGTLIVKNLAEAAQVTYAVEDSSVATVSEDGVVTGVKEGTTKVIATVTQYGRTDSFEAEVTVEDTLQCDGKVDADEVKENIELSEEEKQNITAVEIILQIVDLGKEVAEEVKDAFGEKINGFKVGSYFDIDIFKQFGTNTPDKAKLTGPVKISFMIPEELRNANYSFRLLKYHNNEVKDVVITVSDDYKLTFESDEFSTYALVYYETAVVPAPAPAPTTAPEATTAPVAAISPKTGDANDMLLWFALMAVTAGSAFVVTKKRKENL